MQNDTFHNQFADSSPLSDGYPADSSITLITDIAGYRELGTCTYLRKPAAYKVHIVVTNVLYEYTQLIYEFHVILCRINQ